VSKDITRDADITGDVWQTCNKKLFGVVSKVYAFRTFAFSFRA